MEARVILKDLSCINSLLKSLCLLCKIILEIKVKIYASKAIYSPSLPAFWPRIFPFSNLLTPSFILFQLQQLSCSLLNMSSSFSPRGQRVQEHPPFIKKNMTQFWPQPATHAVVILDHSFSNWMGYNISLLCQEKPLSTSWKPQAVKFKNSPLCYISPVVFGSQLVLFASRFWFQQLESFEG